MAKMLRMVLMVAADKLADMIDAAESAGVPYTIGTSADVDTDAIGDDMDDDSEIDRKVRAANASMRRGVAQLADRGRAAERMQPSRTATHAAQLNGRRVVYTPAGTRRQLDAAMSNLRKGTLSAFVLPFVVKHPHASKRQIVDAATKAGFNGESVDNVVWRMQRDGILKSVDVSE